ASPVSGPLPGSFEPAASPVKAPPAPARPSPAPSSSGESSAAGGLQGATVSQQWTNSPWGRGKPHSPGCWGVTPVTTMAPAGSPAPAVEPGAADVQPGINVQPGIK